MELWLLGAGAVVLVGITLWIVWPAGTADPVGMSVGSKEVVEKPMTGTIASGMAPHGDRFEDQYTSATADLSAGGVAAALEAMQPTPATSEAVTGAVEPTHQTPTTPPEFPAGAYAAAPFTPATSAPTFSEPEADSGMPSVRTMGLGVGVLLAVGGGVGGAWLYARWQRERNKPINRLRRSARQMAKALGERLPDVDELPRGAAPLSGAATALLVSALLANRAFRRDSDDAGDDIRARATDLLRQSAQEAVRRGRKQSVQDESQLALDADLASDDETRKPAVMGIGLGGMAVVAAGAYAIWRLLRRGEPDRSTWYAGEEFRS